MLRGTLRGLFPLVVQETECKKLSFLSMALFSQRKGIRPLQKAIQFKSIDDELRNCLWTAFKVTILDHWRPPDNLGFLEPDARMLKLFIQKLWVDHFKLPIDTIRGFGEGTFQIIRERFFAALWWEIYDFLEFAAKNALRNRGRHCEAW